MRLSEITARAPRKPRTPEQMRATAARQDAANARVADVRQSNAIKLAAAQRKAAAIK